jgi:hypothetical protein
MRCVAIVLALAGCGRIDFGTTALAPDDGPITDGADAPDAPGQPAIPSGAKIWLRMDTDPSVAIDSAGGHAVACSGTCPTQVPGIHGTGYRFTMEQLHVTYTADLDSTAAYSTGVWAKLSSYPSVTACIWSKPFNSQKSYDTYTLCTDPSGTVAYDSESAGGLTDNFSGGVTLPLDEWHHLALTWDGTTKRGYYDGVLVGMSNAGCGSSNEPFELGADGTSPVDFMDGTVDDAVYYTRVLTAAEVMQLATP